MRVGTYNVHEFEDENSIDSMSDVLDTLRGMSCDIIGLQEVPTSQKSSYNGWDDDEPEYEGKGGELDDYIEQEYGSSVITARASQRLGNTLLIKEKFSRVKRATLWGGSRTMRSAAIASVSSDVGRVTVCSVHLDDQREMARLNQFRQLEAELAGRGPAIVFGDFNALRESDYDERRWKSIEQARYRAHIEPARHELMSYIDSIGWIDLVRMGHAGGLDAYADSLRRPLPTELTSTSRYGTRVDYLFATPQLAKKVSVAAYDVVRSRASDHQPVLVELAPTPKVRARSEPPSAAALQRAIDRIDKARTQ